jgi:DNA polymerase epsilon subunit 3
MTSCARSSRPNISVSARPPVCAVTHGSPNAMTILTIPLEFSSIQSSKRSEYRKRVSAAKKTTPGDSSMLSTQSQGDDTELSLVDGTTVDQGNAQPKAKKARTAAADADAADNESNDGEPSDADTEVADADEPEEGDEEEEDEEDEEEGGDEDDNEEDEDGNDEDREDGSGEEREAPDSEEDDSE